MSSRSSSVGQSYEREFSEFLIKRIVKAGGSLQLQHITGHLSQVKSEVRDAVGKSKTDLLQFLKRHNHVFIVKNNVVSLANSSDVSNSGYESDTSSIRSHSNLPESIKNGKGVVIKLFPGYGFIKSKEPVKTEIFFVSQCFGDKNIDLTSFLHIGSIVFFNAVRNVPKDGSKHGSKYCAKKVWRIDNGENDSIITQKSRKTRTTGLYDPLTLESEGVIQNVFPNLGFISVKGDDNNTVFFHKNRVINYDNIVDLTKVFSKGDKVEFTAHRSSKPDAKARWEATKVWKTSGKIEHNISQSTKDLISLSKQPAPDIRTKSHEMIKNQPGKIYPRSSGAVIKFGKNELADGDSAVYYVCGTHVLEIGWEFSEGQDIYFDAVKIKSAPGWKAVLVWTDTKPDIVLPTCLGDFTEFTEEEEDNDDIPTSIYTSRSSLCKSESSNSSVKSEKVSSKNKDVKMGKNQLSNSIVGKEIKMSNYQKLSKNHSSSRDSLSSLPVSDKHYYVNKENSNAYKKSLKNRNLSSPDSLNFEKSKSSSNKSVAQENRKISNWCDSVDEAYESMNFSCHEAKHFAEDEVENLSEYLSAEEEYPDETSKSRKTSSQDVGLKCAASIKKYHDIKGEIRKVFPRFAEVKSPSLQKSVSFSLHDFYSNRTCFDELGVEDLKHVLKVGDSIHFNCFVIVDDSAQTFQKVTLAWKGPKPNVSDEMSPKEFIEENDLSVTVNKEISIDDSVDKVVSKKFLTSYTDLLPEIDNLSKTESCSEEESLTLSPQPEMPSKTGLPIKLENLSDTVYKILKRNLFINDSMVDLKSVSEEIISTILQNCSNKTNNLNYNIAPEESCVTKSFENSCSKCKEINSSLDSSSSKLKHTTTQTIITGDIISTNILAEY